MQQIRKQRSGVTNQECYSQSMTLNYITILVLCGYIHVDASVLNQTVVRRIIVGNPAAAAN